MGGAPSDECHGEDGERTRLGHRLHSSTGRRGGSERRRLLTPVRVDVGPPADRSAAFVVFGNIWFLPGINVVPDSFTISQIAELCTAPSAVAT